MRSIPTSQGQLKPGRRTIESALACAHPARLALLIGTSHDAKPLARIRKDISEKIGGPDVYLHAKETFQHHARTLKTAGALRSWAPGEKGEVCWSRTYDGQSVHLPIAYFLTRHLQDRGLDYSAVFGEGATANSPRSVFTRSGVLEAVFDGNHTTTEIRERTGLASASVTHALRALQEVGLLTYETLGSGGGVTKYRVIDKSVDPRALTKYSELAMRTVVALNGRALSPKQIAERIGYSHPCNVSHVASRLTDLGALQRETELLPSGKKTDVQLTDEGRYLVRNALLPAAYCALNPDSDATAHLTEIYRQDDSKGLLGQVLQRAIEGRVVSRAEAVQRV